MVNEGTLSSENAAHERQQTVDAWVDVGGTFTDCFVRRSGHRLESCKVLSSGRVPLTLKNEIGSNDDSSRRVFTCPELSRDVDGFWCGADLLCLDEAGQVQGRLKVDSQRGGRITLSEVLHGSGARSADNASEVGLVGSLLERSGVEGFRLRFELDARIASPVLAVRRLLGVPLTNALPPLEVRLGTTRGTNALLTRTGAKTVFAVTAPFEDLLLIGDQTRPDLFALNIEKLEPLNELTIGIHERLAADGSVLLQLDESQARHELTQALESGGDSLAICLLHSPTNPAHEQRLAEIAREVGFRSISVSSELVPFIEILTRAQTTVLDAYLSPVVRRYLELLIDQFGSRVDLKLMTSAGGLVDWKRFRGKDCILSGPAGGVAALTKLAKTAETSALIGLDMGGTSTDVCRVTKRAADEPDDSESRGQQVETSDEYAADLQYESEKAGVKVVTPTLPIETVASGGGSICWFDGVRLRVGPQSAGAAPGPACYGRGGPLTVTDLNVYLGRVPAEQFPFPIDVDAIEFRLEELLEQLVRSDGNDGGITDRRSLCRGFRRLANEQMAEAVRTVSIRQGADPRQHALAGFGGAAGQHICEIADSLGITTIVDAPEAGLLSALGMGCADALLQKLLPVYQPLSEVDWGKLAVEVNLLQQGLLKQLAEDNGGSERAMSTSVLEMRFAGTDSTLPIECLIEEETSQYATSSVLSQRFHAAHRERFGYSREGQTIELVAIRCDVRLPGDFSWQSEALSSSEPKSAVEPSVDKWADSESVASALEVKAGGIRTLHRAEIPVEETVLGPCVILNSGSTFVLDGGWSAECQSSGILVATKVESPALQNDCSQGASTNSDEREQSRASVDIVFRECFGARLQAIATQMGDVLQQTSVSVNVKRRRDYSCAVFDSAGRLLANAPHVPVHLGAMGETVRTVIGAFPWMAEGDSFLTNDPYRGGSHLPDLTLVTPVFENGNEKPVMFVANRAHHADVGGLSPGSMSIEARCLGEEGVVIPPTRIPSELSSNESDRFLRDVFMRTEFAPRKVDENLMDFAAQRAANQRGSQLLQEYAIAEGWEKLQSYGKHLRSVSRAAVENYFRKKPVEVSEFEDFLDDGARIKVRVETNLDPDAQTVIQVDFRGTSAESPVNFNANPSIVRAALVYVLRCMLAEDLPLNEGVLECVDLIVPQGLLNPKPNEDRAKSPAVAAGNVETSQRVVDVLLGAFGVAAASQGTMNNLLFGNDSFGFYETLCGGSGATATQHGASAVHSHMTNTRITDPEVLEANFPVRLLECRIRTKSGGGGQFRGGDGLVREVEFLDKVHVSLLTSRRGEFVPYGLAGGTAGQSGQNWLIDSHGRRKELPACTTLKVDAKDRIRIETPGGGGYGAAESSGYDE